ncbi:MAG: YeeE/YedE thiosulfate transporter family protein [Geodermatophilaceae bacterium]
MADRLSAGNRRRRRDRCTQQRRVRAAGGDQSPLPTVLVGGFLLGAGGWIAGGCNLGHGLSGMAQLNVSSIVVVICMALGVGHARAMTRSVSRTRTSAG